MEVEWPGTEAEPAEQEARAESMELEPTRAERTGLEPTRAEQTGLEPTSAEETGQKTSTAERKTTRLKRLNTPFRNTISLIIMNQGIQYLLSRFAISYNPC